MSSARYQISAPSFPVDFKASKQLKRRPSGGLSV
jgi:hypothetical protein